MFTYWFEDGTIISFNHELTVEEFYPLCKKYGGLFMYCEHGRAWWYDRNPETGNINIIDISEWK